MHTKDLKELIALIVSHGYAIDMTETPANAIATGRTITLRNDSDGKVIVRAGNNGKPIWLDCRTREHGDYWDFAKRIGVNTRQAYSATKQHSSSNRIALTDHDRFELAISKCSRVYESAKHSISEYLVNRGIDSKTQCSGLFKSEIRVSLNATLLFYRDAKNNYCGYEIRNHDLKSFGKDTIKGLFISQNRDCDSILLCESAIEAMSAFTILNADMRYASVGGSLGKYQLDMIQRASKRYRIICGFNNDQAGKELESRVYSVVGYMETIKPDQQYKDWNQQLLSISRNQVKELSA